MFYFNSAGEVGIVLPGPDRYAEGMDTEYVLVMTTFPNPETAEGIVNGLLEERLAACIQTLPIQSAYRWKGAINREPEVLALIKTRAALYAGVEAFIQARHPYETPEIIRLPVEAGSAGYLQWIQAETK